MPYEWSKRATDLIEGQYHGVVLGFGVDRFMRIIALYGVAICLAVNIYFGVVHFPMQCTLDRPFYRHVGVKDYLDATCDAQDPYFAVNLTTGLPDFSRTLYDDYQIAHLITEPFMFHLVIELFLLAMPIYFWISNSGETIHPHVGFVQSIMLQASPLVGESRLVARKDLEVRREALTRTVEVNDVSFLKLIVMENITQVPLYHYYVQLMLNFDFRSNSPDILSMRRSMQSYLDVYRMKQNNKSKMLIYLYFIKFSVLAAMGFSGIMFYLLWFGVIPIAMNNDQKIFWCPMPFAKITNSAQTAIINNLNAICNMDSYPSFMMMFYSNITILVSVIAMSIYALISLYVKIRRNAGYDEFEHFLENLALTDE